MRRLANANSNLQYCETMSGSISNDSTDFNNILLLFLPTSGNVGSVNY